MLFCCTIVITSSVWDAISSRAHLQQAARQTTASTALLLQHDIEQFFANINDHLDAIVPLATSSAVIENDQQVERAVVETLIKAVPALSKISLVDRRTGVVRSAFPRDIQNKDSFDLLSLNLTQKNSGIGVRRHTASSDAVIDLWRSGPGDTLIVAEIRLDVINMALHSIGLETLGAAALYRADGLILLRKPENDLIGKNLSSAALFKDYLNRSPIGTYTTASLSDGVERIISYRLLERFGLVISVAVAESEVLHNWFRQLILDIFLTLFICLAVAWLGSLLTGAVYRLKATKTKLEEETTFWHLVFANVDQGFVAIGPDGHVKLSNASFCQILQLDLSFVAQKPHVTELRRKLIEQGEYRNSEPAFQQWIETESLKPANTVYERVRPNGAVLEVRNTMLPGGGAVRIYTDISERRLTELMLAESEHRYRLLADNSSDLIVLANADRSKVYISPAVTRMLGYGVDEAKRLGLRDFVYPDDQEKVYRVTKSLTNANPRASIIYRLRRKNGSYLWAEAGLHRVDADDGATIVLAIRDITDRRTAELQLRQQSNLLETTLDTMQQGLMMVDGERRVQVCNRRAMELLDLPVDLMRRKPDFHEVLRYQDSQDDFKFADDAVRERLKSETYAFDVCQPTYQRKRANGMIIEVSTIALQSGGAVRTFTDVTERIRHQDSMMHAARYDGLTSIPNRRLFLEELERQVEIEKQSPQGFAVLCLDLDRFKAVNDTYGHKAGDDVLSEVASRLRQVLRAGDTVARLGGDEFAILLVGEGDAFKITRLGMRIIEAIGEPFETEGQPVSIGVSIGVGIAPDHGLSADQLLKCADLALYRAKSDGRNTVRMFEASMDSEVELRRSLAVDMRLALRNEEFRVHYQPIVDTATGEVRSYEALLRWQHPVWGEISPAKFIPIAEDTKLIIEIGAWLAKTVCAEAVLWPSEIGVAINLSPVQFQGHGLAATILGCLLATRLAPSRLELEITESVLMIEDKMVLDTFSQLRALGVRIALDDFGTGFSSLSYLSRFPLDTIKIDKIFVQRLDEERPRSIVRAILALGSEFQMKVVAEGIETEAQRQAITGLGCQYGQGYLFARPSASRPSQVFLKNTERNTLSGSS